MSSERIASQGASLTLHFLMVSSLFWIARPGTPNRAPVVTLIPDRTPLWFNVTRNGGGGGGDRSEAAASPGTLPALAPEQLAPPEVVLRNLDPLLAVIPTLLGAAEPALRTLEVLGDPMGVTGPPSNGPGLRGGIGSGDQGGVGPGNGPGAGPGDTVGIGNTVFRAVDGVTLPQLIYTVEPEFTDEARKARYQGAVTLRVVVGADGFVRQVELVRGLGFGLDERAIEAVKQWRFRPGTKNGRPVNVEAAVEVTFRLL